MISLRQTSRARKSLVLLLALSALAVASPAQDWFKTETSSGADRIRVAVADFKPATADSQVATDKSTFDTTLYSDLANAGIFDMVSKSLTPQATPGGPSEISLPQWSGAPASAAMVAFGSLGIQSGKLVVSGYLFDAKNSQYPQVLAKQYSEEPSENSARQIAHRFADEIIFRLGGGVSGIAETKIFYVHIAGGTKEIWMMDYDGANQHAITHLGTVSISPRVSPDNSRVAFSTLGKYGFQIQMYSLLLNRTVAFSSTGGTNLSPAWAPSGREIAFSSSRSGDPDIWITDATGGLSRRVTSFKGPDVSPTYNPKTGAQIAWISGRTGLPQLYIMETDGSGIQRMTDGGYATSPSWSPNGQFVAFAWDRKYGPGAPGGQDIYVMEVASKKWIQLTHDGGRCDFPSWSPDGRHIVYANSASGRPGDTKVWTMLADGTQRHALTGGGGDMPNWSWK
ncbi:Tol-Pal system beta propeller repeat protein TolB [Granulicella arctica]|uniref:Tol-Pal system beta propeller repeat protein TolB n=1 Tax=Granulicella arctica TaxID=940613 RepID=UPI0021E0B5FF|nr:Tol-Pal system beta propeller repeat protein TolB [Granulicella arctica]